METETWYILSMPVEGWMNLQQAAQALGIKNTSQLRKLIQAGHLAAEKPGGRDWMVREEEVARYLGARRRGRPRKKPEGEQS
jgi:excisionase family DNA binding protein